MNDAAKEATPTAGLVKLHPNTKDISGQKFGRLTVLGYFRSHPKTGVFFMCACNCGTFKQLPGVRIRKGDVTSCGCFQKENAAAVQTKHGDSSNGRISPEYKAWSGMVLRCKKRSGKTYKNYGKRGIRVCERWRDFRNFLSDMGRKPTLLHSIERKDVNGNYEPDNCKWATQSEQARNKRNNVKFDFFGERLTIVDLAKRCSIPYPTLYQRLRVSNWDLAKAMSKPPHHAT